MPPILNEIDKSVYANGAVKPLTPKEYGILAFLMSHPDQTFTPEEIYRNAWNMEPYACKPIISVHVRHIREKIEENPSHPSLLVLQWGHGYRYCTK